LLPRIYRRNARGILRGHHFAADDRFELDWIEHAPLRHAQAQCSGDANADRIARLIQRILDGACGCQRG
jgi:hypothetical protein